MILKQENVDLVVGQVVLIDDIYFDIVKFFCMNKIKFILKILSFILLIAFGIFMFVYGGYDDSPGAQGLGLLMFIGGIVGVVKITKKFRLPNK